MVKPQGPDHIETLPLSEDVSCELLRARTLELGEIEEEMGELPKTPQGVGLARAKSHVNMGALPENTASSSGINAAEKPAAEKQNEEIVNEKANNAMENSPTLSEAELPDAPMVTREDQKNLKDVQTLGQPKKPRAKAGLKRPAASKPPRAPKAKQQKKSKAKDDNEDEDEEDDEQCDGTQHYDAPSPESPLEPKQLRETFDEVADKPEPKKAPVAKKSAAKAKAKAKASSEPKAKTKSAEKGEKSKQNKVGKKETKESEEKEEEHDSHTEMKGRVSFAGRVAPKKEAAKCRFEVMVHIYHCKIRPSIGARSNSQFEAWCFKKDAYYPQPFQMFRSLIYVPNPDV